MNTDINSLLRGIRGQFTVPQEEVKVSEVDKRKSGDSKSAQYKSFLAKYSDLEHSFPRFNNMDLVYFFREKARECGIKYVITAVTRDMAIFKRLAKNYEIREVLLMIEFLFSDEQDYLDKVSLQPTILASRWLNTIYADSIAWSNDEYVPHNKRRKSNTSNREWTSTDDEHSTKIGEW